MKITIEDNAPDVSKELGLIALNQVPFANSKTINSLTLDIRNQEQGNLDKHFEIRTTWLTKRGAMPVKLSKKRDYPMYGTITVKDEVAALSAVGGKREADNSKGFAVPFENVGDGSSTRETLNPSRRTLTAGKWPSKIVKNAPYKRGRSLKKPKPFYIKSKSTGKTYVARRRDKHNSDLIFLYGFKRTVEIKKTWPLIDNAQSFVRNNYSKRFKQNLINAIKTSKR